MNYYESGTIVWVKLSQNWWPGSVKCPDDCPIEYVKDLKKEPLAIIKFFNEPGLHHVTKQEQIFSYNCNKKKDFIKKGLNSVKGAELLSKFEDDVVTAEKLTGGNEDLINEVKQQQISSKSKRIDYSHLGFGEPKHVKKTKDENHQRKGFSNIGEAILYKPNCKNKSYEMKTIEHIVKIMEQPKSEDFVESTNFFKCYIGLCGFTCSRLNVIVWHNKNHLKSVVDYDTGIKVPYRRKRKPRTPKNKAKKLKTSKNSEADAHSQTNGDTSANKDDSNETKQLLLDWDDDEDKENEVNGIEEPPETNGIEGDLDDDSDSDSVAYDDNYPPPQPKKERQPMPKQDDIDSAFDALLAESSPLNLIANNHGSYINNDSDSEGSWEKYYERSSDSEQEQESDIRDICEDKKAETNGFVSPEQENNFDKTNKTLKSGAKDESSSSSSQSTSSVAAKRSDETPEDNLGHSTSSNSSNSSGPAYMLVAVDAHGNNVPMPVLNEAGNHLVAVEASMEDGSTRTLYIDPAHLGPNVDLNNLMLHIDNSGQETVIIPTSTSDGEIISSTLVDHMPQDKDASSASESDKKCTKSSEDSPVKRKMSKDGESLEMKLNKIKKSSKSSKENAEVKTTSKARDEAIGDALEELPDLNADLIEGESPFEIDEIVWAMTHGFWWPSFVVKVYEKDKKASVLYINCQQTTPIKLNFSKIKAFNYSDFIDIFENQKDKAVGLSDAMKMASQYKTLREDKTIQQTPKEFFSLPVPEQKDIFRKMYFLKRGIPFDDSPIDLLKMGKDQSEKPSTSTTGTEEHTDDDNQMDNYISGREKQKLESAQKARRGENERYIRFIHSGGCLYHLRQICRGEVKSKRHDDFLFFSHQLHYWNDLNKRHNPAMEFFGPDDNKQLDQMYQFLESQFMENDLKFLTDGAKRGMYVKLVLFPEAVKEALRHLTKIEEKKLESTLAKGIFQTATEKKVKRLEFE